MTHQPYRDSFGDDNPAFWAAVVQAGRERGYHIDPRLQFGASAGLNQKHPSDGGFAIAPEHASTLMMRTFDSGRLLRLCTRIPISKDSITLPAIDETSRVNGSRFGGAVLTWLEEGETLSPNRPRFGSIKLQPHKALALIYATRELVEDAPALTTWLENVYSLEAAAAIETKIISGGGTNSPIGVLNSDALITVAAEGGQAAGTIVTANILKMWDRFWAAGWSNGVWLINSEIFSQIATIAIGSGSSLATLLTFDADGPRLLGRPVISNESCPVVGQTGDVLLIDPSQILIGDRGQAFENSIHVRFLYDEACFRFRIRVDAQPSWKSPVTPLNGTTTKSAFVALATRA